MKKYFVPLSVSLLVGIAFAYFIIHQYESLDGVTVSALASEIYYVQRGVYSDRENMENNMREFTNYIYNVEDNMYHTYIGVSKYRENAEKIQNIYKNEGIETIIKNKIVDSKDFMEILSRYDDILKKTDDTESIKVITRQTLAKYEEYVNGKREN